jgi:hypothetical protein
MSRFLTCEFRLVEIDTSEAWGSLTQAFEQHCGHPPDYDEATGDAATGFYLPAPEGDEAQVMLQLKANGRAVRRALWLLAAKHSLETIRLVTRPEGTTALWHDVDWRTAESQPNQAAVTIWPPEPNWPVRDRVIISYTNEPTLFVHRARRDPQCDWCVPAQSIREALSFASVERAHAWINSRGASERHVLAPTYKSVAAALLDQTLAERARAAR